MTRVLHIGNIANNAYLNAKFLRRIGVEADAFVDETHVFSRPEWEDAPVSFGGDQFGSPGLAADAARAGWTMPAWVHGPRVPGTRPIDKLRYRGSYLYRGVLGAPRHLRLYSELRRDYTGLREALGSDFTFSDMAAGYRMLWMHSILMGRLDRLFGAYDLVQAYTVHPVLTMLTAPRRPYVAFEHGTMREVPFEDSPRGRLLALAYLRAEKVFITNPDVVVQAKQLGLDNYLFLPHPVDETKYTPGPSPARRELGLQDETFLLFSPSRQDWDIKANDVMLRAFAQLAKREPRALLVLTEWGEEVARSRALARELGVAERVCWLEPLPKLKLIEMYRAADIVLDQFLIGTFGAIAPEAMACGAVVVMAFDRSVHEWCYDVQPPVVPARTVDEVAAALLHLVGDDGERDRISRASREWVVRHHNWRLVAERQRSVYEQI